MMEHLPPEAQVTSIVMGILAGGAVSALAKLGVADHLELGPKTAEELAVLVKCQSGPAAAADADN